MWLKLKWKEWSYLVARSLYNQLTKHTQAQNQIGSPHCKKPSSLNLDKLKAIKYVMWQYPNQISYEPKYEF